MKKSFFDTIPGVVRLDSRVAIYVPSTTDTDHPTDNRRQVEEIAAKLSAMFGGATATEARRECPRGLFSCPLSNTAQHRTTNPRRAAAYILNHARGLFLAPMRAGAFLAGALD